MAIWKGIIDGVPNIVERVYDEEITLREGCEAIQALLKATPYYDDGAALLSRGYHLAAIVDDDFDPDIADDHSGFDFALEQLYSWGDAFRIWINPHRS